VLRFLGGWLSLGFSMFVAERKILWKVKEMELHGRKKNFSYILA
jgi:hypothetical protein